MSIETGDLGRLAPAKAIGRVVVKAGVKPAMAWSVSSSQLGSLRRAETRPSQKCLSTRGEERFAKLALL